YPQAWYVLGEFYYHFAGLFDQSVGEARVAFNRVLDLDPRFSPAIGHLIALAHQAGDRAETERLIRQYLRIDSTSVVAEAVRLAGVGGEWAERERDLWVLTAHDAGLPALGDWERAAARLSARPRAVQDTDVTAHWALARAGVERRRHAAALARLAAGGAPLPT